MNLPFKIALRYLLAKKSTQVIQLITGISILGLTVGTAALVLVLSVFNGFEDLIMGMYVKFNPDIKITPVSGKFFNADASLVYKMSRIPGVEAISGTLEEIAFFTYKDKQDFGMVKGVDTLFSAVSNIDSCIKEGVYLPNRSLSFNALIGLGIRNKLGIDLEDPFASLTVYMPKNKENTTFENPFRSRNLQPIGTFMIQQEYDNQYIITTLNVARELVGNPNILSAWEIKVSQNYPVKKVVSELQSIVMDRFYVKDYYAQEEGFIKLMRLEKWLSFAIVGFMLLLVAFNQIGALWMIVLDKKRDVSILKSIGSTDVDIRNLFLYEGLFLTGIGLISGVFLALFIFFLQKTFHLVAIPGSFVVDSYPISLRWEDFITVAITVLFIGLLASIPAALRAMRISTHEKIV
ncbi:membrane protein [Bacteroidota bacterium]|nr:membrane protein [Bacteroidota bacterium]